MTKMNAILFFLMVRFLTTKAAVELGSFGADPDQVSVSGLSSGAYMAVQVHVALSQTFMGAGIIAGGPYHCAEGDISTAVSRCMAYLEPISVQNLQEFTKASSVLNRIDSFTNMKDDKVYLFSGSNDLSVVPEVMQALWDYYDGFVNSSNILAEFSLPAGHAYITETEGNVCSTVSQYPWISDCDYNQAFYLLNHIYGGSLMKPDEHITSEENFYAFNQSSFITNPTQHGMDNVGFVYIPTGCDMATSDCRVHVALHGCQQSRYFMDDLFARTTGYNEVVELNDIIVIYPQAYPYLPDNPNACWDWWGYTGMNYAFKTAVQIEAIQRMVQRVL